MQYSPLIIIIIIIIIVIIFKPLENIKGVQIIRYKTENKVAINPGSKRKSMSGCSERGPLQNYYY